MLCVKWEKPVKSAITLDPEDVEDTVDLYSGSNTHGRNIQEIWKTI